MGSQALGEAGRLEERPSLLRAAVRPDGPGEARLLLEPGIWVDRLEHRWPFPSDEPPRASDLERAVELAL